MIFESVVKVGAFFLFYNNVFLHFTIFLECCDVTVKTVGKNAELIRDDEVTEEGSHLTHLCHLQYGMDKTNFQNYQTTDNSRDFINEENQRAL